MNFSLINVVLIVLAVVAAFGIPYFLTIKPQKKRQQNHVDMVSELKKGDEVMTAGGLIGKVVRIKEDTAILELAPDRMKIKINKASIVSNLTQVYKEEKEKAKKE